MQPQWYSDHSPLSVSMKANIKQEPSLIQHKDLQPKRKFLWNEVSKHNYITNIHSIETQNKIREYINTSHQDPDNARDELLNIITDVATKSVPLKDVVHRECSESELKHLSKENKETLQSAKQKYTRDRKAYAVFDTNFFSSRPSGPIMLKTSRP